MPVYVRPDPTQPGWCDTGEAVRPSNPDIAVGWPDTQIPPSRQEFNWLDKQQDSGIKYLCRVGIAQYSVGEQYQGFGLCIGSNGSVYWNLRACQGVDPVFDNQGFWELTNVRISDADARYLSKAAAASLYLTQTQGDARYQLKVDMANYVTFAVGDSRYALVSALSAYLTVAAGDARYAFKGDLSGYETSAHAAATYLRVVDAANTYLTQSAAAQTYLSIAQANSRFASTTADAHSYTDTSVNNMLATMKSWTQSYVPNLLPGLSLHREDYVGGAGNSMTGEWLIITATPNNGSPWNMAFGMGTCQEGDTVTLPSGFPVGNMQFMGWIEQALGQYTPGDALLNLQFSFGSPGNYVAYCHYTKANDANTWRSRGHAYGRWISMGYH